MVNLYPHTWMRRRVKISGGPPPWVPTDIGGCILWLRSDLAWQDAEKTVACVDSSLIWTGEDKSLDNDVVQATEAARPVYLTNQLNGHPAWRFDAIDDTLTKSLAYLAESTEFVVGKYNTEPASDSFLLAWGEVYAGIQYRAYGQNTFAVYAYDGGSQFVYGSVYSSGLKIFTRIFKNNDYMFYYENGISQGTIAVGTISGTMDLKICRPGGPVVRDVGEVIIYDSVLSDANRQLVENYLKTRYAIY